MRKDPRKGEVEPVHVGTPSRIVVRPASRADIGRAFATRDAPTVKAWVGEIDGRTIGIGGLALRDGRWVAFLDLSDEAGRYKVAIVRAARAVMREAARGSHRFVYADADPREPGAKRLLTSIGFEPDSKTGLFRWRA